VNLLVLGDSLSDGGWERDPAGVGSAWPASLARLASESGIDLALSIRARGGSRSTEVLGEFRESATTSPGIVAVLAGTNDVWRRWVPWLDHSPVDEDDFRRNLRGIAKLAFERGASAVWILTPVLLNPDPDHPWNEVLRSYREICREAASMEGAILVPTGDDLEAGVRAHPEVKWSYDGIHPRPVAHERLAWTVLHHGLGGPELPTGSIPPKPAGHRLGNWP